MFAERQFQLITTFLIGRGSQLKLLFINGYTNQGFARLCILDNT